VAVAAYRAKTLDKKLQQLHDRPDIVTIIVESWADEILLPHFRLTKFFAVATDKRLYKNVRSRIIFATVS